MVWLRRFTRLGGNGVQSPFVYGFVCEVLANRSTYYAYNDLRPQLKQLPLRQQKVAKLLFRLANRIQPSVIFLPEGREYFLPFLNCGCRKATVTSNPDGFGNNSNSLPALYIAETSARIPSYLPPYSLAVVLNIRNQRQHREEWRSLVARPWATLTFDLYHTGIVLFCPERHKQHFKINF